MKPTRQKRLKAASWLIPLAYATAAMVVGMIFPRFEYHFLPGLVSTMSASAALAICSSISSGMIALTGIVFSLTFVMVQFSATAYSPRLVLWVARDPVMSHSLGVFSATFLYALTLLAWVDRGGSGKVPVLSTWLVVVLLLASMGMFIALVERIGLLQINRMLIFTGDQGRRAIAELYRFAPTAHAPATSADHRQLPVTQTLTHAGPPRVVQAVRMADLVKFTTESDAVVELMVSVGDTVLELTPLLHVYGACQVLDEAALRGKIELGEERTFQQDPKYALRLVVDIAIKALSPAINDPTTAVQAMDQIEDLLIRLGLCQLDIGEFKDRQGALRVIVPVPLWDDFLLLGLDEIRAYGAESVQVMRRMKALIANLITVLPADRHASLHHWEERLAGSIARSFDDAEEKRDASVADRQGLGIPQEETGASS